MDRLTTRAKDQNGKETSSVWYNPYTLDKAECIFPSSDKEKHALEKLAAYEDTGLTPEEVVEIVEWCKARRPLPKPIKRLLKDTYNGK